jgi:hypothetical protein
MHFLPLRYEPPETLLNSYNIAVQKTIATATSSNYSSHNFIINLVSLCLEIISVLTNKSSFHGVDNPGRGLGRAEVNRYTTQTRQTNNQMAVKEKAIKQKCGRWVFQSGVDDDSCLMGNDDTSFSIYHRLEGDCWLAPSSAVQAK